MPPWRGDLLALEGLRGLGFGPVDVRVSDGVCLAVMGESGSGKTRLLRAIADLDPAAGACLLDGVASQETSATEWRRQVAYVPAEPGWWAASAIDHFADANVCREYAGRFGVDPAALSRPISELSTGERQRLALARALQFSPRVLLLDEPTGPLDDRATEKVEGEVKAQMSRGVTVVLVTHDSGQAARLRADTCTLVKGRIA